MTDNPDPPPSDIARDHGASDPRLETIAAIVRNGLSNGPIAWSQPTWDHLQTRLGEIVRAIVKEL